MAFKEDWSFLDKITMGAVGTESVIKQLNAAGHQVIELERYCTSNKIWATKIKRLRIPDLLCLRCGRRIESRAKSKLGIIMSDAENNPDRRWFAGLRKTDFVAFIQCYKSVAGAWKASNTINLFSVGDMLLTENQTSLSAPKSVSEGAERDRTWASYTPSSNFTVMAIDPERGGKRLRIVSDAGRNQSKFIGDNQFIYVREGEAYSANARIASGIVPQCSDCQCTATQYDFLSDLRSNQNETVYTAVKALGFLPVSSNAMEELRRIADNTDIDNRIRLEAYASLLRLGLDVWDKIHKFVFSFGSKEIKMEYAFILGELNFSEAAIKVLMDIILDQENDPELRAAAIWSLPPASNILASIMNQCFSSDDVVANHAIAKIERNFAPELTDALLSAFGANEYNNAICARLLSICSNVDRRAVVHKYLSEVDPDIRNWILFAIGLAGAKYYEKEIVELDVNAAQTKSKLILLWKYLPKFLGQEQIDGIEFIKKQK